jgi:hypothetical protein
MANMEGLEHRVRTFEDEANGEKRLTRYTVGQTQRSGEAPRSDVNAVTMQVDSLTGDTAAIKSALTMHGGAFNLPQQDVWQHSGEVSGINDRLDTNVVAVAVAPRGLPALAAVVTEVR